MLRSPFPFTPCTPSPSRQLFPSPPLRNFSPLGGLTAATPLEQFELPLATPTAALATLPAAALGTVPLVGLAVALPLALALLGALATPRLRGSNALFTGAEGAVRGLGDFLRTNATLAQQSHLPLLLALGLLLISYNLTGLLPYGFTLSAHIMVTLFYSLTIFGGLNWIALNRYGASTAALFLPPGTPFGLLPLMVLLEFVSYCSRPLSLSIRLFANMMAGHALLLILLSFVQRALEGGPLALLLGTVGLALIGAILLLELAVAALQAFVYLTLVSLYLQDGHAPNHGEAAAAPEGSEGTAGASAGGVALGGAAGTAAALGAALLLAVGVLLFTAAFTLLERKLMALAQRREGPDRVGFEGLGQPFADALKLLRKETLVPKDTPERRLFFLAPLISLWLSLTLWGLVPFSASGALCNGEVGLLLVLGLSSLGSYGVIYAGWSSNSKYALLGAFRAVAAFISYEVILSLLFLPLLAVAGSANLVALATLQGEGGSFLPLLPLAALALVAVLAETNRAPFDLPEAEAELVAGFNVEYAAMTFAYFFLAEYSAMGFFGALLVALFGGGAAGGGFGGVVALVLGVQLVCALFIAVRATLPRIRFDQLISLCWKSAFPLALALALLAVGGGQGALLAALATLAALVRPLKP